MAEVAVLPRNGGVFVDPRDPQRWLRVSWHPETASFVISTWHIDKCVAAIHLPAADMPRLLSAMTSALADAVPDPLSAAG
jgi:hypothetical protein